DPTRLRQIVLNLLGNAIKFTSIGYVEVRVEIHTSEKPTWKIRVIDTGIGIPEDKQKLVFEAFSQADNSTTRRFGGTGLGLAISSELVRLMNGSIEVSSQENVGSEFAIVLPLQPDPDAELKPSRPALRFAGQIFLIVDPCRGSRVCLEQALTDYGARVISFESWFDQLADERPAWEQFDAVIAAGPEGAQILAEAKSHKSTIRTWIALGPDCPPTEHQTSLVKPCYGIELINSIASQFDCYANQTLIETESSPGWNDPAKSELPKLQVLIAEDGIVNQCVLLGMLELMGQSPVVANNGREAAELIEAQKFDLCLMDLDMPELDGIEATKRIRAKGITVPIYSMTAHHDQQHEELCKNAGMNGYLTKPINPNDLQHILGLIATGLTVER
ncbi:MAG: ATP-binding protein, partial [Pirellula sp.]